VLRSVLLAAADSRWLREHAVRWPFVRRAVSRFMPGETVDDALRAAVAMQQGGIGVILTQLGENVASLPDVDPVVAHYQMVFDRLRASNLDAEVSIKLTQLGLDQDEAVACRHTAALARRAAEVGCRLWIDMEGSAYTDRTLEVYRCVRKDHPHVGVALQSYLKRTPADLESLLPLGPAVRVVKGAYREPASIAHADKADVDEAFFELVRRLLSPEAVRAGAWLAAGTHDLNLIARIEAHAAERSVPRDGYEFALLYGIQRAEQERLARAGVRTRVLISYGDYWFPWYMRRLAERPANLGFVMRNMLGR
jgi:proline dehydrogenase